MKPPMESTWKWQWRSTAFSMRNGMSPPRSRAPGGRIDVTRPVPRAQLRRLRNTRARLSRRSRRAVLVLRRSGGDACLALALPVRSRLRRDGRLQLLDRRADRVELLLEARQT